MNANRASMSGLRWRGLVRAVVVLACIAGGLCVVIILRYREVFAVESRLRAIPGVTQANAWGSEGLTVENIGAVVDIEGKGQVTFFNLAADSFHDAEQLSVYKLGPLRVVWCTWGYAGAYETATGAPVRSLSQGSGIRVGRSGWFSPLFPFPLRNVQDVIARHDDIVSVVSTWPRAPAFAERRFDTPDKDGPEVLYPDRKLMMRYFVTDSSSRLQSSACADLARAQP